METLVANLSGSIRREKLHGREFLVAPMTLIVPGVMNGSKGPLLYELEDIKQHYQSWDGMPILINHPETSGRNPQVWNETGVGWVFNTTIEDKLSAEGWFDIERLQRLQPNILNALLKGEKVELSTGLGIDLESVSGVDNAGRQYTGIARKYRPDHLAILPDTVGACGIKDGCGVNNNLNEDITMPLSPEAKKKMVDNIVTNCSCWNEEDRKTLEEMTDKALTAVSDGVTNAKKLAERDAILNAAREGFAAGNGIVKLNDKGEWVHNAADPDSEKEEEEEEEEKEEPKSKDKKEVKNNAKPITLKDLPIEVQNQIAYGNRRMEEDKAKLIDRLVNNASHLSDEQKTTYRQFLTNEGNSQDGIQKLETLAMALPAEEVKNEAQNLPVYLAPVFNRSGEQPKKREPMQLGGWDF